MTKNVDFPKNVIWFLKSSFGLGLWICQYESVWFYLSISKLTPGSRTGAPGAFVEAQLFPNCLHTMFLASRSFWDPRKWCLFYSRIRPCSKAGLLTFTIPSAPALTTLCAILSIDKEIISFPCCIVAASTALKETAVWQGQKPAQVKSSCHETVISWTIFKPIWDTWSMFTV